MTKSRLTAAALAIVFSLSICVLATNKDNEARQALEQADAFFDLSQYREARNRYHDAIALAAKKGDSLGEAKALSQSARLESYLGHNDLAQAQISKAFELLKDDRSTPDAKNAYGHALAVQGELFHAKGNFKKALNQFAEAQQYLEGDQKAQARVHLFIGYINGSIGNPEKARAEITQALDLYRSINDKAGEGQALTALGLSRSSTSDNNGAIELHKSAIEIFRAIGDRHSEAIANNGLGQAYERLSEYPLALDSYERALHLFEDIRAVNGTAPTNCYVGRIHLLRKDSEQALAYYTRCFDLSRTAGMARTEIYALNEIAKLYAAQNRLDLALAQFEKIQKFCESTGDRRGLATALNVHAAFLLKTGQNRKALDAYERARSLSEAIGDKELLMAAWYGLARTNLALGAPEAALSFVQRSLKMIEDLRANVASPEFRISYFSGVRQHYDLCIQILDQLERSHPGNGFAAEALLVSERSRARLLRDLVNESRANVREGASKELLEQERELRGLIRLQAELRMNLASDQKNPAELADAESQLAQLKAQYQQVEAQVRQQNPYLSLLDHSDPISLKQIQKGLQADDLLLEYSLGDERSYLWAITPTGIELYDLAKRREIEDAAREFYSSLTARGETSGAYQANIDAADKELREKGNKLSQMLLSPVANQLGNRRLLIVAEGALQYIPFAALPTPGSGAVLLETHEIVSEPSFSALSAIRSSTHSHASAAGKLVAVIADPVLNTSDERVRNEAAAPSTALASTVPEAVTRSGGLGRLTHASEEADAIAAVAPWSTTMVVRGFDASRETAMSPEVGQYQIIHFATHGFVNPDHPELSGIVLSMVDRNGAKTDGFMPLHDIYSLDLSAQLTVLSACQTGLGKDIKGEGLVGLSHAIMSAGSKSVVASLWKVDDRATAILMRDFYAFMLQQGMTPAAALRAAQLKMMRDKPGSAPYYWAGFVLQGEYTNRIAVDHRSSLRLAFIILFVLVLSAAGLLVFQRRKRRISPTQST